LNSGRLGKWLQSYRGSVLPHIMAAFGGHNRRAPDFSR
jgi:hypothetical protein